MGTQILFMLVTEPFAITAGIILGDILVQKTKALSVLAVVASMILSILGIILSLYLADMSHKIPKTIIVIAGFIVLVIPSLVSYNFFTHLKRKKTNILCNS
jgi:uncharacterized membrane protein YjjB (DUF3815 family)